MSTKNVIKNLDQAVELALQFYKTSKIPNNATEYQENHPPGMGRTAIRTRLGLTFSEFIKLLNTDYKKLNEPISTEYINSKAEKLGFELVEHSTGSSGTMTVTLKCNQCQRIQTKSYKSLANCTKGCVYCTSKNIPVKDNPDRLKEPLKRVNATLLSDIPSNQTGFVQLRCLDCSTEYTTQLVGLISPNSTNRATCPNCRSSDRRVVHEGITFGSMFEQDAFITIKNLLGREPRVHVPYKELTNTNRRWNADFVLDNIVIEVSSFKSDYKNYLSNLEEKRLDIVNNSSMEFMFFNNLKDLEVFLNIRYSLSV